MSSVSQSARTQQNRGGAEGGTWPDAPINPAAFLLYAQCLFTIVMMPNGILTKIK